MLCSLAYCVENVPMLGAGEKHQDELYSLLLMVNTHANASTQRLAKYTDACMPSMPILSSLLTHTHYLGGRTGILSHFRQPSKNVDAILLLLGDGFNFSCSGLFGLGSVTHNSVKSPRLNLFSMQKAPEYAREYPGWSQQKSGRVLWHLRNLHVLWGLVAVLKAT